MEKADYSISYPIDWLIKTDEPRAEIFICAPLEGVLDSFPESFNLMKQTLLGKSIDLYLYDSISKSQILTAIGKDAIIESKIEDGHSSLLFKGPFDGRNLKWKQLYFVKNETAYILTYTAEEIYFDKYSDIAESIFNSFKLK